jgi:hypothetical protein
MIGKGSIQQSVALDLGTFGHILVSATFGQEIETADTRASHSSTSWNPMVGSFLFLISNLRADRKKPGDSQTHVRHDSMDSVWRSSQERYRRVPDQPSNFYNRWLIKG